MLLEPSEASSCGGKGGAARSEKGCAIIRRPITTSKRIRTAKSSRGLPALAVGSGLSDVGLRGSLILETANTEPVCLVVVVQDDVATVVVQVQAVSVRVHRTAWNSRRPRCCRDSRRPNCCGRPQAAQKSRSCSCLLHPQFPVHRLQCVAITTTVLLSVSNSANVGMCQPGGQIPCTLGGVILHRLVPLVQPAVRSAVGRSLS